MKDRKQTCRETPQTSKARQSTEKHHPRAENPRQNPEVQSQQRIRAQHQNEQKKLLASSGSDERKMVYTFHFPSNQKNQPTVVDKLRPINEDKPRLPSHIQRKEKEVIKLEQFSRPQHKDIFVKHNELPPQSKKINDIPLQQRRLDSLAWLIQGDDTCGAAYFDGSHILLATNNNKRSDLITKVVGYFIAIAKDSQKLSQQLANGDKIKSRQAIQIYKASCHKRMEELHNYVELHIELYANNIYRNAFRIALKKLTHSLQCVYLKPENENAMDKTFSEAIRNAQLKFITVNQSTMQSTEHVHAEMKIVDYLLGKNKLNNRAYIGISKKCCKQCTMAIKAVNHVKKSTIQEGDGPVEIDTINIRDSHGYYFKADCPAFLEQNLQIQAKFLELMNVQTLREAFNKKDAYVPASHQVHLNSVSDPCSLSDVSPNMSR